MDAAHRLDNFGHDTDAETQVARKMPNLVALARGASPENREAFCSAIRLVIEEYRFQLDLLEVALSGPDCVQAASSSLAEMIVTAGATFDAIESAAEQGRRIHSVG